MSYGNPQPCKNQCGAWIYFDKDSAAGHPSADKWLPLEYNHDSGIKTGLVHQCPNRPKQSQQQSHEQIAFVLDWVFCSVVVTIYAIDYFVLFFF